MGQISYMAQNFHFTKQSFENMNTKLPWVLTLILHRIEDFQIISILLA